jgi:hypothetical protein
MFNDKREIKQKQNNTGDNEDIFRREELKKIEFSRTMSSAHETLLAKSHFIKQCLRQGTRYNKAQGENDVKFFLSLGSEIVTSSTTIGDLLVHRTPM